MSAKSFETVHVALGDRSYDILIGAGQLGQCGDAIAGIVGKRKLIVITDDNVAPLYLSKLEATLAASGWPTVASVVIQAGEASKALEHFADTAERVLALGVDRKTVIIALGGGVVGDLAGFLAATLLRGIDFIQIPTTLLAQVDSSVGGKTAVDSRHGKNLIGAFHQPLLVIADTDVLTTLPPREMKAGYAEVLKYALLGDPDFFEWLEINGAAVLDGDPAALVHAIAVSCRAKARIVQEDEREEGRRALLNLGHTFAHALETESGFGADLNHGEAVAIGMALAFDLSVRLDYCPVNDMVRVRNHLVRHGLRVAPARNTAFEPARLIAHMAHDKKAEGGRLTFILAHRIGDAFVARDVQPEAVEAALTHALAAA
jgi:3-dehydroquinate synthase